MAATLVFQATDTDSSTLGDGGTYTFALTVSSAAGQERLVAIGGIGAGASAVDYTAVTIDGEAATRVGTVSRGANDGGDYCAFLTFWRAPGTAGTTINVVATFTDVAAECVAGFCALWSLNDAGTLLDTTNVSGNDPNLSTDTATGGTAAAALLGYSDGTLTGTWSGLTERFDGVNVFGDDQFTGASSDIVSGSTPLAISADIAAGRTESVASICVSFNPAAGADPELDAEGGSYAVSGTATDLERGRQVVAGGGSYAISGTDATFDRDRVIIAGGGSYTINGTDATLDLGYTALADAGSYAVSGSDATFDRTYILPANGGSYAISGTDAALSSGRTLDADGGSYAIAGGDATFSRTYILPANGGSYAISGTAAALLHGYVLNVGAPVFTSSATAEVAGGETAVDTVTAVDPDDTTTYNLTGTAATFDRDRVIVADAGSYTISGTDADLTVLTGVFLTADAGSYAISGTDAAILYDRTLVADTETYSIDGTDAALEASDAASEDGSNVWQAQRSRRTVSTHAAFAPQFRVRLQFKTDIIDTPIGPIKASIRVKLETPTLLATLRNDVDWAEEDRPTVSFLLDTLRYQPAPAKPRAKSPIRRAPVEKEIDDLAMAFLREVLRDG